MRRLLAYSLTVAATAVAATPAPAQTAAPAEMAWSATSRFGGDADGDARLDRPVPGRLADLNSFPIVVRPSAPICAAAGRAAWRVDGRPAVAEVQKGNGCRVLVAVRGEGKHRIEVRLGRRSEVAQVTVDDLLVVALGDSVASGEGNPEGRGLWLDRRCHRSAAAGFQQATTLLAQGLSRRSITFVSLACSGAEIEAGLLGPYAGVAPEKRLGPYEAQVERLRRIAARRAAPGTGGGAVDAVLLSVGANDVRFASIVKACAAPGDCRKGQRGRVLSDLERLRGGYDRLGSRLNEAVPGTPVLITEYFDPTRDERGRFCRRSVAFTSRAEARWAYEALLRPLNAEVSAAAARNRWRFVEGIAADFERHGYCADRVDRWVRRLGGSLLYQRDQLGTFHPSRPGHAAIAQRVAVRLARVLSLAVPPRSGDEGRSTPARIGTGVAAVALAVAVAVLPGMPVPLGGLPWPLLGALLALILLPLLLILWLARRLLLLLRPTWRPDPCPHPPARPQLGPLPGPGGARGLLLLAGGVAVLIALATLFAGLVGSTILWLRFWSARLPADQAVDAVSRGELFTTGAQALAIFVPLGLIAMGVAWLLDGRGQWVRATRRGLVAIGLVELLVAVLIGDFPRDQALRLFGGLVVAALLLYFLLDRALTPGSPFRSGEPVAKSLLERLGRWLRGFGARSPGDLALRLWRWFPLLLLLVAVDRSFVADGEDRLLEVLAPLALAAVLFVLPGGIAAKGTARLDPRPRDLEGLEPARVALAVAASACLLVLIGRDEAWLAAAAGVAAALGLFCLAVAAASGRRFALYGLAVLIAVPLFGGAAAMLRGVDSPELQPLAAILQSGEPVCGAYVGESEGRLWVGRLVLDERADVNRPRRGDIFPIESERVAERALGPLQPVARVQARAVELRDRLLGARRDPDLRWRSPTCDAPKPVAEVARSPARQLAERYQPELIIDRRDGFWPVPVKTLFSMRDRRAAACRRVGPGSEGCLRLTSQGEFPWAGGAGESIEYPAADTDREEQHDLMVDALGSADPDRTAAVYFLVAGEPGDGRPITIQYWFFYPFNYQPIRGKILRGGFHEGDFESVGVLLSARSKRPRYLWMARHDKEGRVLPWNDEALLRADDHPRVFVAWGSHASYAGCAAQIRYVARYHLVDDHPSCDSRHQLQLTPEQTPLTDLSRVAWGCWQGRFGHTRGRRIFERIPYLVADAPLSPLWQQDLGGARAEPCRGLRDPGGREGPGEEVVEEEQGVPATLRREAGRLEALVDDCADWESPPAVGTYMVACDQRSLSAYVASGLEDPGAAGVRIDEASRRAPQIGQTTLPAVRRDRGGVYLDSMRIAAASPTVVSVYASCRQGGRIVGARFREVEVDPARPLRLLDWGPHGKWRLSRGDGATIARARPFVIEAKRGELVEVPGRRDRPPACGGG